jgi:competence protein ComEC
MDAFALRPRKPCLALALSAVLGIVAADWWNIPAIVIGGVVLVSVVFCVLRPSTIVCCIVAALGFAFLHTTRHVDDSARRFAASLRSPRASQIEGVVWSEPNVFESSKSPAGATFWLKIEKCEPPAPVVGRLCLARWSGESPVYGDRVRISGMAQALESPRNPGQFDVAGWLSRQGVHFELQTDSARGCEILGHGAGEAARRFGIAGRAWIKNQLERGLPPDAEISTLINSMILGLRGDTPPALKEVFQKTGTLHLFAVSGLNVGMLAVIGWYAVKPLGFRQKSGALVIIPCLAAYAVIVGMSASCTRATVVAIMLLGARFWERDAVPLNSLGAAAVAILAWDTNELFNPGFQLSFVLVMVIMGLSRRLQQPMQKWAEPDDFIPRRLWTAGQQCIVTFGSVVAGTLAVGVAAWLGSVLFMWGYFHLVSPVALLANLVAVPLAFCILALGLLSLVAGILPFAAPAIAVNHANWLCARALIASVDAFSIVPSGHRFVEWPAFVAAPAGEITVLDVGDGAAIHVRANAADWLIDAGHQRDYPRILLPYLRSRGINRLQGICLTHGDTAHLGGAAELLDDFQVDSIGEGTALDRSSTRRALHAQLAAMNIGRRFFWRGVETKLGGSSRMRVLYPPQDLPPKTSADDKSLVLQVEVAGRRVLFTSDIGFSAEEWLLQHEPDLESDILVKGWAHRDFSGTPDFIRAVRPQAVVCSARGYRSNSAEVDEWCAALRKGGVKVFAQSECGAVRIRIAENGELEVTPWLP